SGGGVTLTNSTISDNSAGMNGGISANGAVAVRSSILAGNRASRNPDLGSVLPSPPSPLTATNSLLGSNQGTDLVPTGRTPDANGNLIGSAPPPPDPLPGPLQGKRPRP